MLSDGYAAVSSRSVAAKVGINAPLVHYYFPTIDDLFVAVLLRRAEPNVEHMAEALASSEPLRAWWDAGVGHPGHRPVHRAHGRGEPPARAEGRARRGGP